MHDILSLLSLHLLWQQRGGVNMQNALVSLIVTVVGGIIVHLFVKWLDRKTDKDN